MTPPQGGIIKTMNRVVDQTDQMLNEKNVCFPNHYQTATNHQTRRVDLMKLREWKSGQPHYQRKE